MRQYKIFKKFEYWKGITVLTNVEINYENYENFVKEEDFEFLDENFKSPENIEIYEKQDDNFFKIKEESKKNDYSYSEKIKTLLFSNPIYYTCPSFLILSHATDFTDNVILPSDELLIAEFQEIYDKKQKDFKVEFEKWKNYKKSIMIPKENSNCVVFKETEALGKLIQEHGLTSDKLYEELNLGLCKLSMGLILFEL
jgi:hypothetical protein